MVIFILFYRDNSSEDSLSAKQKRLLQNDGNDQVKSKANTKTKRRKSRDRAELSLPPDQHHTPASNSGPSQQQHSQQRPRSSPAMDEQHVEMTAVLHNTGGCANGTHGGNNKTSTTPAPSTRHSHSGAHSPAIVQILPQQQSSSCLIASPSHPSQMPSNYHHQQQVPQAYQPPDYYNVQPQPQPPPPSAATLQSRRHDLRSRESSRWSLSQQDPEEHMLGNNMEAVSYTHLTLPTKA